jgi:hypothetical protein
MVLVNVWDGDDDDDYRPIIINLRRIRQDILFIESDLLTTPFPLNILILVLDTNSTTVLIQFISGAV